MNPTQINLLFPQQASEPNISRLSSILCLCIALSYGFFLSYLPTADFKDFNNYLDYADGSWFLFQASLSRGLLPFLSNEPIWLLINSFLRLFITPESVVRAIIFLSASSVAWLVFRHYPRYIVLLVLFLLMPQVIKNFLIHLRQGAAIAVFLYSWFSVNRVSRWLLLCLTPLIHSSFIFILILLLTTSMLQISSFASDIKILSYLSLGILFGNGLRTIAEFVGARQAETYAFQQADASGIAFLLWSIVFLILLSAGKSWLATHYFEIGILLFYLSTYFLVEVTGRIFESGLLVLLLSSLSLDPVRRRLFSGIVIGSGAISWFLVLDKPLLGYA